MNTMRVLSTLPMAALVIVAVLAGGGGQCAAGAQTLRPYLGETAAEFEARKNGQVFRSAENQDAVTIPADRYGHYQLQISIGGQPIRMVVDTGASAIALSHEDALAVGLNVSKADFTRKVETANGPIEAAPVRLKLVTAGTIALEDVDALVLPPKRLGVSLLGMSFLNRLGGFEIANQVLTLRP